MKKDGNKLGKRKEQQMSGVPQTRHPAQTQQPLLPGFPAEAFLVQQRTGPLPDPQALAEYDRVNPGFAERIVAMAEQQAAHRRSCEAELAQAQAADIRAARSERKRGQIFGIIAVLGALIVAAIVGTLGKGPWAASAISGVPLAGIIVAFVAGQIAPSKSNGKK